MKKIIIILLTILCMIFAVSQALMYTFPVLFTYPQSGYFNDYDEIEIVKFDVNKPTFNYYSKDGFRVRITQVQFERQYLFTWKLVDAPFEETITEISSESIGEVRKKYSGDSISEINEKLKREGQANSISDEERYLQSFNEDDIKDKQRTISFIESIQIGMSLSEIESIIGFSDRAFNNLSSEALGYFDLEYVINDEIYKFVFLSFDESFLYAENPTLMRIGAVTHAGETVILKE